MKVILVCHTELGYADSNNVYFDDSPLGVQIGVKNIFKIIEKHNVKICFVLKPEILPHCDDETLNIFSENQIGLHIHPDDNVLKKLNYRKSVALRDYTFFEQKEMIRIGKEIISDTFGITPKVFVAGRFSENNDTIKALIELWFTHDCTAFPRFLSDWCNWMKLNRICTPYRPSKNSYQEKGDLPLIIIPASKGYFNIEASPDHLGKYGINFLKACFEEYYLQNLPVFHIFFHSNSMTEKNNLNNLDSILEFIKNYNVEFVYPTDIIDINEYKIMTIIFPYLKYMKLNFFKRYSSLGIDKIKRIIKNE